MNILIAAHGTFAEGITKALEIIVGAKDNVTYINAYIEGVDVKKELETYMETHDDILALTDLFGGSVNQEIMKYMQHKKIKLIAGINLPLALEMVLGHESLDDTRISEIINEARNQMVYVNEVLKINVKDDFE